METGKRKKENVIRPIQHLDQHMAIFPIFRFYKNGIRTFINLLFLNLYHPSYGPCQEDRHLASGKSRRQLQCKKT